MTSRLTRRSLVAALGVAAVPAAAMPALAARGPTPMERLWGEAETLKVQLEAHRDAISAAAQDGGIPGWMRLGREANQLGEKRYACLVAILNGRPATQGDLAIMSRAALDDDIRYGGVTWAGEQLARATIGFTEAAA